MGLHLLLRLVLLASSCMAESFPNKLTIYEFGSKEHAGGVMWDSTMNHPKPYPKPENETMASLLQYLTPVTMPSKPFPTSQYTVCWNMNVRMFGKIVTQIRLVRLFHNLNTEWSHSKTVTNGDYWLQLNQSANRGTLIMTASMISDNARDKHIWSGGLGNYTTEDNPLLRWGSFCIANDFQKCWTRYYIGMKVLFKDQHTFPFFLLVQMVVYW